MSSSGESSSAPANNASALPPRKVAGSTTTKASSSSLWPVEPAAAPAATGSSLSAVEQIMGDQPPIGECAKGPGAVCCRDLKGEDERHLLDPDVVGDIVIGLSDGLTVPFALTAGLSGLGSSRLVVLGGLAELIAGAISMGTGGYLAAKSELDHFHYLRTQTHARVLRSCNGELEREVHDILGSVGCEETVSRLVTENLLRVESEHSSAADWQNDSSIKRRSWFGSRFDEESDASLKWSKDVGVSAFLLRFGEGLEEVSQSRLYISAATIGMSYFIGGLIPLLPYFFVADVAHGLAWSSGLTLLILLIFGLFKTYFTGAEGGARGYAWGAISTMLVGGLAAGAAYGLVKLLEVHE